MSYFLASTRSWAGRRSSAYWSSMPLPPLTVGNGMKPTLSAPIVFCALSSKFAKHPAAHVEHAALPLRNWLIAAVL